MAKGQKRGNREIKKPKQQKATAKIENPFGKPNMLPANTNASQTKAKT